MKELYRQKNKEIFTMSYNLILIEYLYEQYKNRIIKFVMPPYLIHLVSVYLFIILAEQERNEDQGKDKEIEEEGVDLKDTKFYKNIFNLVAFIFNLINLMIFFAQSKFLKMTMFYRPWTYLDII